MVWYVLRFFVVSLVYTSKARHTPSTIKTCLGGDGELTLCAIIFVSCAGPKILRFASKTFFQFALFKEFNLVFLFVFALFDIFLPVVLFWIFDYFNYEITLRCADRTQVQQNSNFGSWNKLLANRSSDLSSRVMLKRGNNICFNMPATSRWCRGRTYQWHISLSTVWLESRNLTNRTCMVEF